MSSCAMMWSYLLIAVGVLGGALFVNYYFSEIAEFLTRQKRKTAAVIVTGGIILGGATASYAVYKQPVKECRG